MEVRERLLAREPRARRRCVLLAPRQVLELRQKLAVEERVRRRGAHRLPLRRLGLPVRPRVEPGGGRYVRVEVALERLQPRVRSLVHGHEDAQAPVRKVGRSVGWLGCIIIIIMLQHTPFGTSITTA